MEPFHGGHVNSLAFYEGINDKWLWKPEWDEGSHTVNVLTLPLSFFHENPQVFGDMTDTAASVMLRTLCWIATESGLGNTSFGVPHYCDHGKPKTLQVWEPLWNILDTEIPANERHIVAYRLWFIVLDPSLDVREGFHKLILDNIENKKAMDLLTARYRARKSSSRVVNAHASFNASGALEGGMIHAPERRVLNKLTLVNEVISIYRGEPMSTVPGSDQHTIYSSDLLARAGPNDPMNLLSPPVAFEMHTDNVCPEQCNLENYFDNLDDGVWRYSGKFPKGVIAFSMLPQYFTPDFLCGALLPHIAEKNLGPHYRMILRCSRRKKEAKVAMEEAEMKQDRLAYQLAKEDAKLASSAMKRAMDDMDDEFQSTQASAPSCAFGSKSLAESFSTSFVEETVKRRNDFRKLHEAFTARENALRASFEAEASRLYAQREAQRREGIINSASGGPPQVLVNGQTFPDAIRAMRAEHLKLFWRTFKASNTVMSSVVAAREWFKRQSAKKIFIKRWQVAENVTPFGSMIISINNDFGDTLGVETNFQLMWLTMMTVITSARYSFGLRPNLFVTGDPGTGKSFCVEQAKFITIPGAVMNLTHVTTHAMQGGADFASACVIMEEVPLEMIGIDKYGKATNADPFLKNRLTSGMSVTLTQERTEDGARSTKMYVALCQVTHILISNDQLPPSTSAIMSRFIPYVMRKINREDTNGEDRTLSLDMTTNSLGECKADILLGAQMHHFFVFAWEKAIEAGAMPDIDTTNALIVTKWIFDELSKRNVPSPSRRHLDMMIDLCRIMTIYYGVYMEFFSEHGFFMRDEAKKAACEDKEERRNRRIAVRRQNGEPVSDDDDDFLDESKDSDEFEPWMLEGLVKWGVVTQEIVVFVVSLLEFLWVPKIRVDIARAAGSLAGGVAGENGSWAVDPARTEFRRDFEDPHLQHQNRLAQFQQNNAVLDPAGARQQQQQQQQQQQPLSSTIVIPEDFWSDVESQDPTQFGEMSASSPLAPPPPPPQQEQAQAQQQHHPCPRAAPVGSTYDYRYIELRGSSRQEIAQKIRFKLATPPSENDIMSALNEMSNDYITCRQKKFIQQPDGSYVLVPDMEAPEELIRCVLMDNIPDHHASSSQNRRICIAVDIINSNFGSALKDSIQAALSHKFQQERHYITAFPYTRKVAAVDSTVGYADLAHAGMFERTETLHSVFDTVHVKPNDSVIREVTNMFARTENEINRMVSVSGKKMSFIEQENIRHSQSPRFAVRSNIDDTALIKYWRQHGIYRDEVGPAYAPAAAEMIQNYYIAKADLFGDEKERMVKNYPEDWVERIDARRKVVKTMETDQLGNWGEEVYGSYFCDTPFIPSRAGAGAGVGAGRGDSSFDDLRFRGVDRESVHEWAMVRDVQNLTNDINLGERRRNDGYHRNSWCDNVNLLAAGSGKPPDVNDAAFGDAIKRASLAYRSLKRQRT